MDALKLNPKAALMTPIFFLFLWGEDCSAKGRLSPATIKSIREGNLSFKNCRGEALKLMNDGKLSPKRFKARINGCKERYPGASLFINCKKQALRSHKRDKASLSGALKECKKMLIASAFAPSRPLPFYIYENKHFFAGVGFNRPLSEKELDLPNFDCSKLKGMIKDVENAEYFLFGNHPTLFSGFRNSKIKNLRKIFKFPRKPPAGGHYVGGLGKIFGSLNGGKSNPPTLYFPSGSCVFDGSLGKNFTGLSTYYLIDHKKIRYIPYFAIAFYHPEFRKMSRSNAARQMLDMLNRRKKGGGQNFRIHTHTDLIQILATQKIREFDEEGDPMNVCTNDLRTGQNIVILKGRPNDKEKIEYIILANIKNLCSYGDLASKSFRPS